MRQGLAAVGGNAVLLLGAHFAEASRVPIGDEHRVIAEAEVTTGRNQQAEHLAFDDLAPALRPGEHEGRDEVGAPLAGGHTVLVEQLQDSIHGAREVLRRAGPAGREDARCTIETVDAEAGIVRERRKVGCFGCRLGLQQGVGYKRVPRFVRLGKAGVGRRDRVDPVWGEQLTHLPKLAGIVGGNDETA